MYDALRDSLEKSEMSILFPLRILLVLVTISKAVTDQVHQDCPISRCSKKGPLIKFPFRLKGDPPYCGNPEFEVSCITSNNTNMTMIQLSSSSGLFPIQNIYYDNGFFDVYDGDGCLPRRLLNFSISSTRLYRAASGDSGFVQMCAELMELTGRNYQSLSPASSESSPNRYPGLSQVLRKFTLLNCSTTQIINNRSYYIMPVRCLSVPGHHQVLAVEPTATVYELPESTCSTSKKGLQIPMRVSGNECKSSNILSLEWKTWVNFPECQNCRERCDMDYKSNRLQCYPYPAPVPQHPPQQPKGGHRLVIIEVSIPSFVLISAMAVVAILYYVKKSDSTEEKENQLKIEEFLDDHRSHVPTRYSYADIKKMTNGFRKKLGEGGYGSVFCGKLPSNEVPVAVKVIKDSKGNGDDFVNEVGTIGRIHHVNVVRLLGFSAEGGKRALIYEHMPNGSLEKFITSKDHSTGSFDWMKLRKIITGIAKGIEYLHQGCDQRILHFDIKPHNILLDHDYNPKISDFGLAKLCSKEDSLVSVTAARGTIGYIAPEVLNGNFGTVSYKSDVYSFGMLVLEVIAARKKSGLTSAGSTEVYFPELVYECLVRGEELYLELGDDGDAQIAKRLASVALWCIQWYPVNRPSMKAVLRMLEGPSESLIIPPNPFASTTQPKPTVSPSS